jgi:hypothetical protein
MSTALRRIGNAGEAREGRWFRNIAAAPKTGVSMARRCAGARAAAAGTYQQSRFRRKVATPPHPPPPTPRDRDRLGVPGTVGLCVRAHPTAASSPRLLSVSLTSDRGGQSFFRLRRAPPLPPFPIQSAPERTRPSRRARARRQRPLEAGGAANRSERKAAAANGGGGGPALRWAARVAAAAAAAWRWPCC